MTNIPIVILAGGQSVRMGRDKAEIVFGNCRMVDLIIQKARRQSGQLYLSASRDYETGLNVIPDIAGGPNGPAAGLYSATHWFIESSGFVESSDIEGFLTIPVDAPDFPSDIVEKLVNPTESRYAAGPNRTHPAFAWWRLNDLRIAFNSLDFDKSLSLHGLVEKIAAKKVLWSSEQAFVNINTPNDVDEYLTAIRSKNIGHQT